MTNLIKTLSKYTNTKLAEYNQRTSRLAKLSDKISELGFKQYVIAKSC